MVPLNKNNILLGYGLGSCEGSKKVKEVSDNGLCKGALVKVSEFLIKIRETDVGFDSIQLDFWELHPQE